VSGHRRQTEHTLGACGSSRACRVRAAGRPVGPGPSHVTARPVRPPRASPGTTLPSSKASTVPLHPRLPQPGRPRGTAWAGTSETRGRPSMSIHRMGVRTCCAKPVCSARYCVMPVVIPAPSRAPRRPLQAARYGLMHSPVFRGAHELNPSYITLRKWRRVLDAAWMAACPPGDA
jgi:hypothetical protein